MKMKPSKYKNLGHIIISGFVLNRLYRLILTFDMEAI
jgi:hypothetical protein